MLSTNTRPFSGSAAVVPQFEPPMLPGMEMVSSPTKVGMNNPPCGPGPTCAFAIRARNVWYCSGGNSHGFTSSTVNVCLANGAGFVGNGCVGQDCSPGTVLCGTGRSSIGQSGSTVTRLNT